MNKKQTKAMGERHTPVAWLLKISAAKQGGDGRMPTFSLVFVFYLKDDEGWAFDLETKTPLQKLHYHIRLPGLQSQFYFHVQLHVPIHAHPGKHQVLV